MIAKPCSEACERNRHPILEVLRRLLADRRRVLEIGSGTGQHAVHFAAALPQLVWQTSELPEHHAGIRAWLAQAALSNAREPIALDVFSSEWPPGPWDAAFTANTLHILSWHGVERLFEGVSRVLDPGGVFCAYGPFNYGGRFTSESNARFDATLKARDPASGIRDFETLDALAERQGLALLEDNPMPANNRLLAWRKPVTSGRADSAEAPRQAPGT